MLDFEKDIEDLRLSVNRTEDYLHVLGVIATPVLIAVAITMELSGYYLFTLIAGFSAIYYVLLNAKHRKEKELSRRLLWVKKHGKAYAERSG